MSDTQSGTAITAAATHNRVSMFCLALSYVMALFLIFIVPSQAAQMSSKEYNVFVLVWTLAVMLGVCISTVFFALSAGNRLRTALGFMSLFLAVALLATTPPVMSFVGGNFYGFVATILGA